MKSGNHPGNWNTVKEKIHFRWKQISDDEVDRMKGSRLRLVSSLMQRYNMDEDLAEQAVEDFETKLHDLHAQSHPSTGQFGNSEIRAICPDHSITVTVKPSDQGEMFAVCRSHLAWALTAYSPGADQLCEALADDDQGDSLPSPQSKRYTKS